MFFVTCNCLKVFFFRMNVKRNGCFADFFFFNQLKYQLNIHRSFQDDDGHINLCCFFDWALTD